MKGRTEMKILVQTTNKKNGQRKQTTTIGFGKTPVHEAKSFAGRALKYWAKRVKVVVDGEVIFSGSEKAGVTVNVSSDNFI
jgi:D-alanyl-D-alanine carboxypeptidase